VKKISELNEEHKINIYQEYLHVKKAFIGEASIYYKPAILSNGKLLCPAEYLSKYCFNIWSLRDTYNSFDEMYSDMGFSMEPEDKEKITESFFMAYLQFVENCYVHIIACVTASRNIFSEINNSLQSEWRLIGRICEKMNYRFQKDPETRELFLIKLTSLQEQAVKDNIDLAKSISEYQKIDTKGDLTRKAEILCTLYKTLESYNFKGTEFQNLYNDATFLFNKSGIRHSVEADKVAAQTFEKMTTEQKEKWYDSAFDLFLTCTVVNKHYIPLKHDLNLLRQGNKPAMIH